MLQLKTPAYFLPGSGNRHNCAWGPGLFSTWTTRWKHTAYNNIETQRPTHTHTHTHIHTHTHRLTHRQTVTGTHRHFEKKTWYYKKPILTMWTTGWKLWPGHWKIFTLFSALFEEARENWQRSYVNQNAIFPIQKNLNCKNWVIARQCGQLTRFLWTFEVSKRYVSFSIVVQHNRFRIISLLFPSMVS